MIAGIILAAGRSARLGRPKQLLHLQGEPLLRHTIRRALASSLDEIIVVVGHQAGAVSAAVADLPVRLVVNPDAAHGQSTSVRAGVAAVTPSPGATPASPAPDENKAVPDASAAIFLLGDQPTVDPAVIDALIAAWRETGAPVVAPHYATGIGNPVLFDRSLFPKLMELEGDAGARSIVRAHRAAGELHLVPIEGNAPPDVDTEDDYAALIASVAARPLPNDDAPRAQRTGRGAGGEGTP